AGDRLRNILSVMTRNRFMGLVTGFLITALLQSSSASTVMVVSFVNAGLMTLGQSMAVIFGANVGTAFTAWVISLFGFKVNISIFVLPLIGLSVPLLFCKDGRKKSIGEFLLGFAFLFMGLDMISKYVPDLQSNPQMFESLSRYSSMGMGSVLIFTLVGIVVTSIIQSSAGTFAITLIMCSKGWVSFELGCAILLGAVVGTTITPILASLSGNVAAKRAAMGHLLFNFLGMTWCLCVFYPFMDLIVWLTKAVGSGNPEQLYTFVNELQKTDPDIYNHLFDNSLPAGHKILRNIAALQMSVSIGMSLFYTVFKIINLSIMIWFTNVYVKIVEYIIPSKRKEEDEFQLKFISGGMLSTSELNISQAEKEMSVYAQRVNRMILMARELVHTKEKSEEFNHLFSRLEKYEEISDRMELEIAHYLNRCAEGRLSNESKLHLSAMLNIVSEIESIADSCYNIGRALVRKQQNHVEFNQTIYDNIDSMFNHVEDAMKNMMHILDGIENVSESELIVSYNKEREINNLRNQLRAANVEYINDHLYEYLAGISYMDIIADLEKTGDFIINVVDTVRDNYLRRKS
ncbi:MAG: Na/Pi symporter, partial [Muribaculum sp.]|nr:Na/Pi symporter [Muribaculum sp.]